MQKKVQVNNAEKIVNLRDLHAKLTEYVERVGGLMHALNWLQSEYGYVDTHWIATIADVFNKSQAEVRGMISFYHDFKTVPPASTTIKVCQAEACQALGARKLTQDLEIKFGVQLGSRTTDDQLALEAVYCLGLCAVGPSVQINECLIARATADSIILSSK